jgi:hypothetical protein
MVATLESRKLKIIDSLVALDNEDIIKIIESLLHADKDFWNQLTDQQKVLIEQSERQLDNGLGVPHESVMSEFRRKYAKS